MKIVVAAAAAGAITLLSATGALACRGTTEYPQVTAMLQTANLPADRKAELTNQLDTGRAMHEEAHKTNNTTEMRKSLEILDAVKRQLEK